MSRSKNDMNAAQFLPVIAQLIDFFKGKKERMSEQQMREIIQEVIREHTSSSVDKVIAQNLTQLLEQCIDRQQTELQSVAQEKEAYKAQVDELSRKVETLMKGKDTASAAEPDINVVVKKQLLGILEDFKETRNRTLQQQNCQASDDKLPWCDDNMQQFGNRRQQHQSRGAVSKFGLNSYGHHNYERRNQPRQIAGFEMVNHEDCYSRRPFDYPQFPDNNYKFQPVGHQVRHTNGNDGSYNRGSRSHSRNRTDAQFNGRPGKPHQGAKMHGAEYKFDNRENLRRPADNYAPASNPAEKFKIQNRSQQFKGRQAHREYHDFKNKCEFEKEAPQSGRSFQPGQFQYRGQGRGQFLNRGNLQNRGNFHHSQFPHQKQEDDVKRSENLMDKLPPEQQEAIKQLFMQYQKEKDIFLKQENNQASGKSAFKKKRKPKNKQKTGVNVKENDENDCESEDEKPADNVQSVNNDDKDAKKKQNMNTPSELPPEELKKEENGGGGGADATTTTAAEKAITAQLNLFVASGYNPDEAAGLNLNQPLRDVLLIAKGVEGGIKSFEPKTVQELIEFKRKYPNAEALIVK